MNGKCAGEIAVIGGGPAGLRAAEIVAAGGAAVTLYEANPSVGRKFLIAGRGGLNLTKEEPAGRFSRRYVGPGAPPGFWSSLIGESGPEELREWAHDLGIETFVASTGRVYPQGMKAAPLLRRWVARLRGSGVRLVTRHRLVSLDVATRIGMGFTVAGAPISSGADAVILALGGGSWPETGSDGGWVPLLERLGVAVSPLVAANCGWDVAWAPDVLEAAEGCPLKNIVARAGGVEAIGELMITRYGLEGGAIYQLGPALREMAEPSIEIDLKPSLSVDRLVQKLGPGRGDLLGRAAVNWRLPAAARAILSQVTGVTESAEALAVLAKACPVRLSGPRPLAEAISTAGGVRWGGLDDSFMLRAQPGVFVAGEMIDWEAPTGGYLIQGCFATGTRAGRGALRWVFGGGAR